MSLLPAGREIFFLAQVWIARRLFQSSHLLIISSHNETTLIGHSRLNLTFWKRSNSLVPAQVSRFSMKFGLRRCISLCLKLWSQLCGMFLVRNRRTCFLSVLDRLNKFGSTRNCPALQTHLVRSSLLNRNDIRAIVHQSGAAAPESNDSWGFGEQMA